TPPPQPPPPLPPLPNAANTPASDGSPRSPRQPALFWRSSATACGGDCGDKSRLPASIPPRWSISPLIATHLQKHLNELHRLQPCAPLAGSAAASRRPLTKNYP